VCRWKTPRSGPLVATNSAAEVETATRTALTTASTERERTDALRSLAGVEFPTASVVARWTARYGNGRVSRPALVLTGAEPTLLVRPSSHS